MALYLRKKLDNKAEIAVWQITETEEELADFGMLFGLSAPQEKLTEKICRDPAYEIFENIEKAREKVSVL